ncbi:hypothetical protein BGZ91_008623 [Linnemannia elongata]|nr:hypothetical protein BGZ91_008623 [Linnemannia elongata]
MKRNARQGRPPLDSRDDAVTTPIYLLGKSMETGGVASHRATASSTTMAPPTATTTTGRPLPLSPSTATLSNPSTLLVLVHIWVQEF